MTDYNNTPTYLCSCSSLALRSLRSAPHVRPTVSEGQWRGNARACVRANQRAAQFGTKAQTIDRQMLKHWQEMMTETVNFFNFFFKKPQDNGHLTHPGQTLLYTSLLLAFEEVYVPRQ